MKRLLLTASCDHAGCSGATAAAVGDSAQDVIWPEDVMEYQEIQKFWESQGWCRLELLDLCPVHSREVGLS